MIKRIFKENLPKWEVGTNKGKINWKESIGYKVKFIYDNIEGEVEIVDYESKGQYLWIKYLDKEPFRIFIGSFQECLLGELLGKRTGEFKIEIGTCFKDDNRDITITDRKYIKDKKGQNKKYYKYRCNKCRFECGEHYKKGEYQEELWILESDLLKGQGCACCCEPSQIVIPGINDILTTNPEMVQYFVNTEEAKIHTKGSQQKVQVKCPDCGKIKDKKIPIYQLYSALSINCSCSDKISYPTKLIYNLLKQLEIKFETEYSPDWCKYLFKDKSRKGRYDFYFELNDNKYIVEADGGWHKKNNPMSGQTTEDSKFIDNKKDELAKEHKIEVIRIDCDESNLEYIKNNRNGILNSRLAKLFDLSTVNWNEIEEKSRKNICKTICEYKNKEQNITTTELSRIFYLSVNTIQKYLKIGNENRWCNYDAKEENLRALSQGRISKRKQIKVFKEGELVGTYMGCCELEKISEKEFGVKIFNQGISACCLRKIPSYKGYVFKYA